MFCKFCGKEIRDGALFCKYCGKKVATENVMQAEESTAGQAGNAGLPIIEEPEKAEDSPKTEENAISVSPNENQLSHEPEKQTEEYKDFYCDGKHFVYINSTYELFCPTCHSRANRFASLCSHCNENFVDNVTNVVNTTSQDENTEKSKKEIAASDKTKKIPAFLPLVLFLALFVAELTSGCVFSGELDSITLGNYLFGRNFLAGVALPLATYMAIKRKSTRSYKPLFWTGIIFTCALALLCVPATWDFIPFHFLGRTGKWFIAYAYPFIGNSCEIGLIGINILCSLCLKSELHSAESEKNSSMTVQKDLTTYLFLMIAVFILVGCLIQSPWREYAQKQYIIRDISYTNTYDKAPVSGGRWYWENGQYLKGKKFTQVADALNEQSGFANVDGYSVKYWLYDTYTYLDGYGMDSDFVERYIPAWVESMGKKIDTKNIKKISPNTELSESVRELMKSHNCDISIAHIDSYGLVGGDFIYFHNYIKKKDSYSTIIFPLKYYIEE